MSLQPEISVGLITSGEPEIESFNDFHIVRNMLIGEGFHWQRTIPVKVAGNIVTLTEPQGNIRCVNILNLEDYIQSVTGSEMNPSAPKEFIKAHAVISRSWALRKLDPRNKPQKQKERLISWEESDLHTDFNVCSDDHCQRYQGIQENNDRAAEAVEETYGLVLTTPVGEIADTRFSKCCGGITEIFSTCWDEEDFSYLVSQKDPWCDLSTLEPETRTLFLQMSLKNYDLSIANMYDWEAQVSKDEIEKRLKSIYGIGIGKIDTIEKVESGASPRIKIMGIKGEHGYVKIGKELAIRKLLSRDCLYSSWIDFEDKGRMISIRGRGWGHGVGLCQIGAARMAFDGKGFEEILSFYYPGLRLTKAYE